MERTTALQAQNKSSRTKSTLRYYFDPAPCISSPFLNNQSEGYLAGVCLVFCGKVD